MRGGGDAVSWTDYTISNSKHIKWKYERVGVGNGGGVGFCSEVNLEEGSEGKKRERGEKERKC